MPVWDKEFGAQRAGQPYVKICQLRRPCGVRIRSDSVTCVTRIRTYHVCRTICGVLGNAPMIMEKMIINYLNGFDHGMKTQKESIFRVHRPLTAG